MKVNFYNSLRHFALAMLFIVAAFTASKAQDVMYSESFTGGSSYCPGSPQYDNWGTFRSQLDTTTKKFRKVTIKGTRNVGGTTCTDPTITRRIAEALRTGTPFSIICDGQKWEVSTGCSAFGCANGTDAIELNVGAGAPCQCTVDNSFRVCIGNANWGGLGTSACPPPTQVMEVVFSNPVGNNAAPAGVTAPVTSCGSATDSIAVSIQNAGINKIADVPVTCKVTGTIAGAPFNNTFNTTLGVGTDSIAPFTFRQFKFASINTLAGADLDIMVYTSLPSDTTRGDDTLRYKYKNVGTPTGNATASNVTICGTGKATLSATVPVGHSAYWYDDKDKLVAVGATTTSPIIPGATQRNFFVASAKVSAQTTLGTQYTGTTSANSGFEGGNMFDLNVKKDITIEAINVHLRTTNANQVTVYIKQGSYTVNTFNKNSWTLVGTYNVTGAGLGKATNVVIDPILLNTGQWSMYVFATDGMTWNTAGNNPRLSVSDFDLGLTGAIALEKQFSTQLGNIVEWNGSLVYRQTCVSAVKAQVTVTANPLPVGSSFSQGTLFKGTYDGGTRVQPDIVASPDTICYAIPAPTNYANGMYGTSASSWNVNTITVKTVNGTVIPAGLYKFTAPAGGVSAQLCFFPSSTFTDSTIDISALVKRFDNGCDSLLKRTFFVAPRPVPSYTNTTVCFGDVTEFNNSSTISSGQLSYLWDFGDTTTSTLTDPAKTYKAAGNYTVTLSVISNYGYVEKLTQVITVKQIPGPNFRVTNACEGTALSFTSTSTLPPGAPIYSWNFGDSKTGTGATTSHLYTAPNIYPVKLTVDVAGCSNSITKYATQAPRSTPNFTFNNSQCDNLNIAFKDTSKLPAFGTMGYEWKFGDGSKAAQKSPEHVYNAFNSYNVTLITATDLGCRDSVTKVVVLKETPKPVFTSTGASCTNQTISFTNATNVPAGSINTYDWSFGDGNNSTDPTPNNTYVAAGTFKVILKAFSTNGCQGETEGTVTISEKPVADFTANNVCVGGETKFNNGSTISNGTLTYTWDLDNGSGTVGTTNPSITYATAKTYNVSLISQANGGCADTVTKPVNVFALPAVNIGFASNRTQDGTMLFSTSSTGAGYQYFWSFGDGGSSNQQNPSYQYNFQGVWSIKLTIRTADGCENTIDTTAYVNPTSVGAIDNTAWAIYPNPSTGKFTVSFEGIQLSTIQVSDMLGKTIATFTPDATTNEVSVDLTNQSAGMYIITLTDVNGKTSTQKISIAK